jgi:molybdate transport system substrate-binding protein
MVVGNGPTRRGLVLGLVAAALALAAPAAARAAEILVFAAASLKNALDEAAASYEAETGDEVKISYAASSALAKQIEQGAPAHVFVSADLDWMDYLDQRDLIARDSRANLLRNSIVLVAPKDAATGDIALAPGLDLAPALGPDGRLAVADVAAVPAGKYGKAALEHLGAWSGVEGRLAQAENVRAALALVSRGEAPLGIVYRTDAAADPNVKVVGTFPEGSHPPIVYPVALTAEGRAAAPFLAFLKGPAAKAAFERQGFAVIVDRPAS